MDRTTGGELSAAQRRTLAAARSYIDARCRLIDAEARRGQPGAFRAVQMAEGAARRALVRLADAVDALDADEGRRSAATGASDGAREPP